MLRVFYEEVYKTHSSYQKQIYTTLPIPELQKYLESRFNEGMAKVNIINWEKLNILIEDEIQGEEVEECECKYTKYQVCDVCQKTIRQKYAKDKEQTQLPSERIEKAWGYGVTQLKNEIAKILDEQHKDIEELKGGRI